MANNEILGINAYAKTSKDIRGMFIRALHLLVLCKQVKKLFLSRFDESIAWDVFYVHESK